MIMVKISGPKFLLQQNPYLKTEKQNRETNLIPIIETGSTKRSFKQSLNGNV